MTGLVAYKDFFSFFVIRRGTGARAGFCLSLFVHAALDLRGVCDLTLKYLLLFSP